MALSKNLKNLRDISDLNDILINYVACEDLGKVSMLVINYGPQV